MPDVFWATTCDKSVEKVINGIFLLPSPPIQCCALQKELGHTNRFNKTGVENQKPHVWHKFISDWNISQSYSIFTAHVSAVFLLSCRDATF